MPMDRSRYPPNWDDIARRVKEEAGWTCKRCGRECYRPGEPVEGEPTLNRQFVLTVHHKDHDPQNNDPDNLEALCAPCHLAEERRYRCRPPAAQMALPLSFS